MAIAPHIIASEIIQSYAKFFVLRGGVESVTEKLPHKLKADAILEAVLEIRFEPDPSTVPEIIFGRFADVAEWREFRHARLPTADIPAPIRRADPNLRYTPAVEMTSRDGSVSVRVGAQVVSYHRRGAYPGWSLFGVELHRVVDHLYRAVADVHISRIGLRYINALRSDIHGVSSIDGLDINISVAGQNISNSFNLNFGAYINEKTMAISRIATVDFAEGGIPENTSVIVDVDVFTSDKFGTKNSVDAKDWIEQAHDAEKLTFFRVLGKEAMERLREI